VLQVTLLGLGATTVLVDRDPGAGTPASHWLANSSMPQTLILSGAMVSRELYSRRMRRSRVEAPSSRVHRPGSSRQADGASIVL
jgi:hypothetical protein